MRLGTIPDLAQLMDDKLRTVSTCPPCILANILDHASHLTSFRQSPHSTTLIALTIDTTGKIVLWHRNAIHSLGEAPLRSAL
jgi:hypothetical protein